MGFDQLSFVLAGLALLVVVGYTAHGKLTTQSDIPAGIPWVGKQHGMFAGLRTRFASLSGLLERIESGYQQYSLSGRSFALPAFDHNMVMIPGSRVKWIVDQPEDVLSASAMQQEVLQSDYTLLDSTMAKNPVQEMIIKRNLTRSLGSLIESIDEEIRFGVDELWGEDTENWVDIGAFQSMSKVIARTSNRVFVGAPLCRNDEYLDNAALFAQDIAISSGLLKLIPEFMKPFLAWILVLSNRWHVRKCSKHLVPFIKQRMLDLDNAQKTGKMNPELNDYTTWHINEVSNDPDPTERTPAKIALRLMVINFAAIHTSTFTATNILFDLFSSPSAELFVSELRDEITSVYNSSNGKWDKHSLAKLVKTDSTIRESLRLSTFMSHGMHRLVVSPKGVTMSDGQHLPQGTRIGTPVWSIHHDDSVYEDAKTFDAFRFSRARERMGKEGKKVGTRIPIDEEGDLSSSDSGGGVGGKEDLVRILESRNLATVTTSDTFLSFGHGRHACPGRFFAAAEMKLLLAYILMNYEIEPFESRPPNTIIAATVLPPMKANIRIRRRKL